MFFQTLTFDISVITVSSTGRVLFYDQNSNLVVAIKKTDDFQLHYSENFLYIWKEGNKPVWVNGGTEMTMSQGSLYKMTVYGLTDIDGKSFTVISETGGDYEEYLAKQQEAFEWLQEVVLAGCCNGGSSSSSVAFYADFASFPTTGTVDVLYVDKATPALYIWNGSSYVVFGGGGDYIPLAGTDVGSPVTGDIERDPSSGVLYDKNIVSGDPDDFSAFVYYDDGTVGIYQKDVDGDLVLATLNSAGLQLASSNPLFSGIACVLNEVNLQLDSFIPLKVMKSRIWTKAGTPTTSDDSTQGYLVGSLIWDTTNSILYKCTDNTASAAVWANAITASSTFYETLAGTSVTNALQLSSGITRFLPLVFSGNFGSATSSQWVATRFSKGGIFEGLAVYINSSQPSTGSLTFELMYGSNPASLTASGAIITVAANSTAGTYTSSSTVTIADGDYVCWRAINNASSSGAIISQVSCTLKRT